MRFSLSHPLMKLLFLLLAGLSTLFSVSSAADPAEASKPLLESVDFLKNGKTSPLKLSQTQADALARLASCALQNKVYIPSDVTFVGPAPFAMLYITIKDPERRYAVLKLDPQMKITNASKKCRTLATVVEEMLRTLHVK